MAVAKQEFIRVGDWVSGTSMEDEKFIGYVEAIDVYGGVKVRVTQCDHDEAVGELVDSLLGRMEKLADYVPVEEADLRSLLDLALMTRDQSWFDDLYSTLRMTQFDSKNGGLKPSKGYGAGPSSSRVKID